MTFSLYAISKSPLPCAPSNSVSSPLDGVQIDAFLMHFPQRRKIAQLVDLSLQQFDRVIDFLFGREAPDGKADGAVRELVAAAERTQYVRGLERRRRAR